jgi:hypothetical protein
MPTYTQIAVRGNIWVLASTLILIGDGFPCTLTLVRSGDTALAIPSFLSPCGQAPRFGVSILGREVPYTLGLGILWYYCLHSISVALGATLSHLGVDPLNCTYRLRKFIRSSQSHIKCLHKHM